MTVGFDEFLERAKRRETTVEGVRLMEPGIEARLAFESAWRAYEDDETGRIVATIAACAVDEDGAQLFDTGEKLKALRENCGGTFARALFDGCLTLLSVTKDEVDAAVGECGGGPMSESAFS